MIKKIIFLALFLVFSFAKTISLDKHPIIVHLKNNEMNVLNFPFVIQDVKIASETPEDFKVEAKYKSLVITPTVVTYKEKADLLVWSSLGQPFLIKIDAKPKADQIFNFVSNSYQKQLPLQAQQFETGRIEKDIRALMKRAILGKKIPGYTFVSVKRKFYTPDLILQKQYFYDGGKYRVETWYLKNRTDKTLILDYQDFYTPGILAISFESKKLKPGKIGKMWLIIDKNTIYQRIKRSIHNRNR